MQSACTGSHVLLPDGATALEIPRNRPPFVKYFKRPGIPAATAVRLVYPPSERRAPRPGSAAMYVNLSTIDPGMEEDLQCVAYAYISPETSPCRAEPGPFLRLVFRTLALDLPQTFQILEPLFGADVSLRFRTHAQRKEAIRRQPFRLDGATVGVELIVPFRLVNVAHPGNYLMVHVALQAYPNEQRKARDILENVSGFGFVREIGCAKPRSSTVCVVLQVEQPAEIPYELHIVYYNGFTSVVPIRILSVWECSKSFDANGEYVEMF
jgi:hypothetical protein